MAPFVTCLNNLSKAITTSTIKVRCVRRYEGVPENKNDNSLECVLHDNAETRIQASFTNNIMQKMASPLREDGPFPEISQMRHYDETSFFDVIGVITNPGRVLNQYKYRLIEIEISDEQHNKIFCTIWESNIDSYLSDFKKSEETIPIVIVQICKPNLFRELKNGLYWVFGKIVSVESHYDTCYSHAYRRYKFIVNIVDDTSNTSLLVWDREGIHLIGKKVYEFVGDDNQVLLMEDIAKEIEKKLVGQSMLFKLQFRNQLEYYRSYPHTVNKVCNIPHVVEKYTPQKLGSQEVRKELKLSDLIFGSDLPEDGLYWVFGKIVSVESHYDTCYCHAYRRYKFIVNIVDDTSNTSLLVWDREGIHLIGKKVYEFVGDDNQVLLMEDIAKEIEKKLVGQSMLFKLQFRNQLEYYRSYPHTVNKVCNIPHVVEKYTPQKLGSQEVRKELKLSDLIFGSDLPEDGLYWVFGKIVSVESHYDTCYCHAYRRYKFIVNIVDDTSNTSLLVWDREGIHLIGKKVYEFVGDDNQVLLMEDIAKEIEKKLVGQSMLFKLQFRNQLEYYRSYPHTVNKVCNIPHVVEKYTPQKLGSQEVRKELKLSDLIFGSDLPEDGLYWVFGKIVSVESHYDTCYSHAYRRYKFIVNIVDDTSNTSLLVWDREGIHLIGKKVYEFVGDDNQVLLMEDIAKEIEKKLVGQSMLFKLQFRNQLEYYRSYPHTVNKVCNIPHVVEKYTPQKLGSQEVRKELKLSDLIFGSDLPEDGLYWVFGKIVSVESHYDTCYSHAYRRYKFIVNIVDDTSNTSLLVWDREGIHLIGKKVYEFVGDDNQVLLMEDIAKEIEKKLVGQSMLFKLQFRNQLEYYRSYPHTVNKVCNIPHVVEKYTPQKLGSQEVRKELKLSDLIFGSDLPEDGLYWVFGKIVSVESHYDTWYYMSCKTCFKKVEAEDNKFNCSLWDDNQVLLMEDIAKEIEKKLVGQSMLFKLQFRNQLEYYRSYPHTVNKVCNIPHVVEKYTPQKLGSQEVRKELKLSDLIFGSDLPEDGLYWVFGKIVSVESHYDTWYYMSCKTCFKKVEAEDNKFNCSLWDDNQVLLMEDIAKEIEKKLVGQSMLFKLQFRNQLEYYRSYPHTVNKVCNIPHVVEKYTPQKLGSQEVRKELKLSDLIFGSDLPEDGLYWVFGKIVSVESHYDTWYYMSCKTCFKKVEAEDNKFNCSLWDDNQVLLMEDIAKEIEKKLVGQSMLFKLQFRNQLEYYRSYPHTVNKVCNIPHVVEKYTPQKLGSQEVRKELKLSDLIFGSDLPEDGLYWVFGKIVSVESHYDTWYYMSCKTCFKKVEAEDNKFNCSLWDDNQVLLMEDIAKEIEKKLVGQSMLFKLQFRNQLEYYRSYPHTVNKVCNIPHVVEKYTPQKLGSQEVRKELKLSDLIFGSDLPEDGLYWVFGKIVSVESHYDTCYSHAYRRYKFIVNIVDDTSNTSLLVWDREGIHLIGKKVYEFVGDDNQVLLMEDIAKEIEKKLVGQSMLFKLQFRNQLEYYRSYPHTVNKVCNIPHVVEKYTPQKLGSQEVRKELKLSDLIFGSDLPEDGLYWVFGKIVSVESHYDTCYSHAYRRYKFIVNIVDDTSNTSLLVWDREGIHLIGKKVYEFVGDDNQVLLMEDIAKEIEKKLVGQSMLFKLQFRNQLEYYRSYPHTVNKVCNIPHVVEKYTPQKLGSQEVRKELKLSDLIFGSDLPEDGLYWVFGKIVSVESHYDTCYSHAYRRYKFIVNIVDDTSNTSLLVWDREGIHLIGKKVYEFVGDDNQVLLMEDIAKEIEKKLVGQSMLFKLQFRNQLEYYRSYPHTVNKVCNIPHVVEKYTPQKLGSQEVRKELKLSDLIFGSDLPEDGLYWVFGKIVSVESHYDTCYSHAYRRYKFIVNIVDDTSNTSLLVWDREGIHLIGKKVYEFVGDDNQVLLMEDIAKEIEKKLVGQSMLFKLQFRNQLEYYRSYPHTVNKVCNIPHVVEKYTPQKLGSQEVRKELKLSDLIFGSDLPEDGLYWVFGKIVSVESHYDTCYSHAYRRYKFIVNIVDDTSNTSLLVWDREGIHLIGKKVYEFVGDDNQVLLMEDIAKEIEKKLVGQSMLFKLQFRNQLEYYRSYPHTVNKVCNIPHVVEKYTPQKLGSQEVRKELKLSDLIFGSDLPEDGLYWVFGKIVSVESHYDTCYSHAYRRYKFIVNIVDDTSNTSLLVWDREGIHLIGKKVYEFVGDDNQDIAKEIEKKLVGQSMLFKLQFRNQLEYYRSYPHTVNKVCNIPHVVEKYTPQKLGSQEVRKELKLSDLIFGSDLPEDGLYWVFGKIVSVESHYDTCYSHAYRRYKFIVNIVDDTSNTSLLVWDREGIHLIGKKVYEFVGDDNQVLLMEDIAKEIEKKLVGQSMLFKLQFRNQLEYYRSYPHIVNKVCNIPHVVEKYTPQKLGSQEVRKELKLSDLIFGSDLPEDGLYWVFGKIVSVESHYDTWYYMSCKTCFKKVEAEDNKFNCSLCKSSYSHAYRRYKFIVNIVDDTSNTSLLVWDREGIHLIGKKVYEFVGDDNQVLLMEDIAKEIEKKLVGQSMLFKLQFRNQLEYYRSYPHTVNKVCNIPHVVEKYTPQKLGSQEVRKELKLSDLIFGSDLPEDGLYWVFGKIVSVESHYDTCYSHAYRRYKFIVNIVDDTSNTSLLVWDREGIHLIGKKVYEFVGDDNQVLLMEDIAKEIEKKLVGQSMLFKLQFRNQLEYYRSYPHIVNKVCNIPHVVEKYTPQKLGSQEVRKELKLSDLIFGSDLPEDGLYWVFGKIVSVESHYDTCYSHAYRRYKFIVNIVDDTSNTSLLVWDREGIHLIGKKVYEFVGDDNQVLLMEDIAKEIEKKLVGQSMLFKLQFRNQLEYYRSYPHIVNKVCNIPHVVEKYTPQKLGSQEVRKELKLSDLIFGSDLPEKSILAPDLSSVTNDINHECNIEGSVKRCLEDAFNCCDDIVGSQKNKNQKVSKED
ncbi:hypothetical protein SASPL_135793 [Salvia splendens]|uniref:Replication factor A C-terminal domain-containing protein n=1 Tax=Salvia splendens TaxID=180675 RepID=A0A8X8WYL7_SALSN|nr:hypothetical protein SASPL_135793 [Salvia splendens]